MTAVYFSACNNSVLKIVNVSTAEISISVDSSDMASDGVLHFYSIVCGFSVLTQSLNVPKGRSPSGFLNVVLLFLKEPVFMYTSTTKDFSQFENFNCD